MPLVSPVEPLRAVGTLYAFSGRCRSKERNQRGETVQLFNRDTDEIRP